MLLRLHASYKYSFLRALSESPSLSNGYSQIHLDEIMTCEDTLSLCIVPLSPHGCRFAQYNLLRNCWREKYPNGRIYDVRQQSIQRLVY